MADTCLCCKLTLGEGWKDPVTDRYVCDWCWDDHWGKNRLHGQAPPTHVTRAAGRAGAV